VADLQGWQADPFGRHEQRYFSLGQPTKLVRDGRVECYDPPPSPVSAVVAEGVADAGPQGAQWLRAEADPSPATAPAPGWWLASDGNWYPPEPDAAPVPSAPSPAPGDSPWVSNEQAQWTPDPSPATAPAPGWWLASDGNWYPPEQRTDAPTDSPVVIDSRMPAGLGHANGSPVSGWWLASDGNWYPPEPNPQPRSAPGP